MRWRRSLRRAPAARGSSSSRRNMPSSRPSSRWRDYISVQGQLAQSASLIADPATDSEMRNLAEEERAELKQRFETLEHDLRIQLLPRDAADASSAIVEIRAGTGGDEAALFAADLLEMYTRYAALQGWRTKILSRTDSDL